MVRQRGRVGKRVLAGNEVVGVEHGGESAGDPNNSQKLVSSIDSVVSRQHDW